jgi:hypothetical protein
MFMAAIGCVVVKQIVFKPGAFDHAASELGDSVWSERDVGEAEVEETECI